MSENKASEPPHLIQEHLRDYENILFPKPGPTNPKLDKNNTRQQSNLKTNDRTTKK